MIKSKVIKLGIEEGKPRELKSRNGRLIVSYSQKRASNYIINRKKALKRLERKLRTGKLIKDNINNRGYNKYLKLSSEVTFTIDFEKYKADSV